MFVSILFVYYGILMDTMNKSTGDLIRKKVHLFCLFKVVGLVSWKKH